MLHCLSRREGVPESREISNIGKDEKLVVHPRLSRYLVERVVWRQRRQKEFYISAT